MHLVAEVKLEPKLISDTVFFSQTMRGLPPKMISHTPDFLFLFPVIKCISLVCSVQGPIKDNLVN